MLVGVAWVRGVCCRRWQHRTNSSFMDCRCVLTGSHWTRAESGSDQEARIPASNDTERMAEETARTRTSKNRLRATRAATHKSYKHESPCRARVGWLVSRHASCVISRFTTKLLDALDAAAREAQISSESQFHCEKDNSSVTTGQDG